MEKQFFEDQEAEEILRLAVRKTGVGGSMTRAQLEAAAAEMDVTPEALHEAEKEYREKSFEAADRKAFDVHTRREFMGHLATYVIVNIGLVGMDLFSDGKLEWAYWSVLGWGIGMLFHAWSSFAKGSEDYEKEFRRWRRRKARRESGLGDDDLHRELRGIVIGIGGHSRLRYRKIEAIRELRERTGASLEDAKDAVDEYARGQH